VQFEGFRGVRLLVVELDLEFLLEFIQIEHFYLE
jgi:hypothetical protein